MRRTDGEFSSGFSLTGMVSSSSSAGLTMDGFSCIQRFRWFGWMLLNWLNSLARSLLPAEAECGLCCQTSRLGTVFFYDLFMYGANTTTATIASSYLFFERFKFSSLREHTGESSHPKWSSFSSALSSLEDLRKWLSYVCRSSRSHSPARSLPMPSLTGFHSHTNWAHWVFLFSSSSASSFYQSTLAQTITLFCLIVYVFFTWLETLPLAVEKTWLSNHLLQNLQLKPIADRSLLLLLMSEKLCCRRRRHTLEGCRRICSVETHLDLPIPLGDHGPLARRGQHVLVPRDLELSNSRSSGLLVTRFFAEKHRHSL